MLTQCKFTLNNLLVGVITMGYQWAILAVFIMFALLEAKNGKLFKKATEVSDDGKVELIGTLLLFIVTQPLVLFCSATMMALHFPNIREYL